MDSDTVFYQKNQFELIPRKQDALIEPVEVSLSTIGPRLRIFKSQQQPVSPDRRNSNLSRSSSNATSPSSPLSYFGWNFNRSVNKNVIVDANLRSLVYVESPSKDKV